MASYRSFTCPLPPFGSPFPTVPLSASSNEVFIFALFDYGEGNLLQRDNVQMMFWVEFPLHRCDVNEGFAQASLLNRIRTSLIAPRTPPFLHSTTLLRP